MPTLWAPLLLVALVVFAYRNGLGGPFFFDDIKSIPENPHIRSLWPIWQTVQAPPNETVDFRPLVSLTLAINYAWGELDVFGYHVVNLLIHVASTLTLFGIARRTLGGARLGPRVGAHARGLAFAIAALWGLHPLDTESVTYIIQRTELLMGLFAMLTLYCVIRGFERGDAQGWYRTAAVCCALGMASKEVMVVVPLWIFAYDRALLADSFAEAWRRRRELYIGLGLSWVVLVICVYNKAPIESVGLDIRGLSAWEYLLTQSTVIFRYVRLAFWPTPLVVDYLDWPIARSLGEVWLEFTVLAGFGLATLWALRARPIWGFLGATFLLFLAPTSSVLPIGSEIAAERRMYVPLVPIVAVVVTGAWEAIRSRTRDARRAGTIAAVLLSAVLIACGWWTNERNLDYRSEVTILRDAVEKRPRNHRAHYNLGREYYRRKQWRLASRHFQRALRLEPAYASAAINLGVTFAEMGQFERAIQQYRRAQKLRPDDAHLYYRWGQVLIHQGKLFEAASFYRQALELDPTHRDAQRRLRWVERRLARERWERWREDRRRHLDALQ